MPSSGLFIMLYDADALNLYLKNGVYGFLMKPIIDKLPKRSRHFNALADYACAREGTHVFFFLKRKIVYGGQIKGSPSYGSYYLNGPYSPMGKALNSQIYWDESNREKNETTDKPGIFQVSLPTGPVERCQPYLIRFNDIIGLQGHSISSDILYSEIGVYPYPLPSNSIAGMSFCTLTPAETDQIISLLQAKSEYIYREPRDSIDFHGEPKLFKPKDGISNLHQAISKAHLEASVMANPDLLPTELKPNGATICRKVPISPFKPAMWMDRAGLSYYTEESILDGTMPNRIIELSSKKVGKTEITRITRYIKWLHKIIPEEAPKISCHILTPGFTSTAKSYIPNNLRSQIKLHIY